jgi:sterol 3beta-glucosyltransferase
MRIAVLTIGSRGDIQPFVALARALKGAGHTVRLGAPPNFSSLAEEHGVEFHALGFDTRALLQESESKEVIRSGNILAALRGGPLKRLRERQTKITRDAWQITQGMDALVYKSGLAAGSTVAEKLDIPAVSVALQPMAPSAAFPPPLSGLTFDAGAWANRALSEALAAAIWSIGREGVRALRRELGLTPLPYLGTRPIHDPLTLHAYSPMVVPKPDDWPAHFHVTGYMVLEARSGWKPPGPLLRFLEAGPPPLYVGFGSMTHGDPRQFMTSIVSALRRAGQRGVVLDDGGELGHGADLPDFIHVIAPLPHEWLFPRTAGVVHHGGAGTTAAALRAGVPSVVVPHNFDQPFWGKRVFELGVAPLPIRLGELTVERLADSLGRLAHDTRMRRRAEELGRRLRAEDGVRQAMQQIHAAIHGHPRTMVRAHQVSPW